MMDRQSFLEAVTDPEARLARTKLCHALISVFVHVDEVLQVSGHIIGSQRCQGSSPFGNGDDGFVALGYASKFAAALCKGSLDAIEADNYYAAAALNRQLVEVEYLAWALSEDHEEADSWLRSDREERRKKWQPAHIRNRSNGRFRGTDYAQHCELGGHPTPAGARLYLNGSDDPDGIPIKGFLYYEVAHHGTSVWRYLLSAMETFDTSLGDLLNTDDVMLAYQTWKSHERLHNLQSE